MKNPENQSHTVQDTHCGIEPTNLSSKDSLLFARTLTTKLRETTEIHRKKKLMNNLQYIFRNQRNTKCIRYQFLEISEK